MALLVRVGIAASLAVLASGQRPAGMAGAFGRGFPKNGGGASSRPPLGATKQPGAALSPRQHSWNSPPPAVVAVPFPVYGSPDANIAGGYGLAPEGDETPAIDAGPPPGIEEGPAPGIPRMGGPDFENAPTCFGAPADLKPPPEPPRPPVPEAKPIVYLIALKDSRILQAFGYWIEGGALHYVSTAYGLNQISLGLVDEDFSRRLNEERGVEFDLGLK
ncbi:MAG TPA: hypothetical protein VKV74_07470 [Bryobacteraceae bacterium]|nr:hypothetical protein [Bryobacteraceae bacterium]